MRPFLILCASASMLLTGSAYSDNAPSADLRNFSLSVSSLSASASSTLNAQWKASARNSPAGYFISAHAIPTSSPNRTLTDENRFLQHNCTPVVGSICGEPHILPCTFNKKHLSCSFHTGITLVPGNYSIVARACVVDAAMNYVCSSKESSLVVLP